MISIYIWREVSYYGTRRVPLTVSLRVPAVALLRGILLLAEGLLLTRALLVRSLLLAVLRVTCQVYVPGIDCEF